MNLLHPQLLLSAQIALLVLLASLFAGAIVWLWCRQRPAVALEPFAPPPHQQSDARPDSTTALAVARSLSEELRRNLAATESQCVEALEQRDEAERQALLRAGELRQAREELAGLQGKDTVPLVELHRVLQQLADARAAAEIAERQRDEAERQALLRADELSHLQEQLAELQTKDHDTGAEINGLKQQLTQAEALASLRQGQLEQLAKGKAEAEAALKTEIDKRTAVPPPAPPPVVQLPRPSLPPVEVLTAPVDDTFDSFPPAPADVARRPLGESLFDEAELTSLSPEASSVEAAHATLHRLEQELAEKEQLVTALAATPASASRLAEATLERDRRRRQVRALTRSLALVDEQPQRADNLTRIKGIKEMINNQLHDLGVFTYRQIVQWDEEDVLAFNELLASKNRIHRDKWQDQARTLMERKYGGGIKN